VTAAFAYDAVSYPSTALPQAHPGHLHAVARMFGCDPAPVDRCRVLELGCGDGTHLIASAVGLPDATFVGLDLSASAVDRGNRLIADLGLRNATFHAVDVTTWDPPEPFDYAIAHGLYSWVPPAVRDAILRVFAAALGPTGVGYVSYNIYPGCYVRRMLWEMMRFHTADTADPVAKMSEAVEFAKFLAAGGQGAKTDSAVALMAHELESVIGGRDPRVLYHDDLGTFNDPVYVREFVAHAGRFGLRFVGEAEPFTMETRAFKPEIAKVLDGLAETDVVRKEQYIDFLRLRRFRETLVSPDGQRPLAEPLPERITGLAVSGQPTWDGDCDPTSNSAVTFRAGKATARTDLPIAKAALVILAGCSPRRVPFADLLARAAAKLGRPATAEDHTRLAELLTAVWMTGMVALHGHVPTYTDTASARPTACPLARRQVRDGPLATTRLHTTMRFEDAPTRRMVELLDGTRTPAEVATEMVSAFPPDQRPDPAALRAGLDTHLARMAQGGLLVG